MPATTTPSMMKGDVGARIRVTLTKPDGTAFNASSATEKSLKLRKPDGDVIEVDPIAENAAGGIFYYDTVEGDVDQSGDWEGQMYLDTPTWKGHSSKFTFVVGDVIAEAAP